MSRLSGAVNIEDLRRAARKRLPRVVFDYIDGGADGEITLRENVRAFEDVTFRPRSAVEIPPPDLRTQVLGTPIALPFIFAPVGSSRMFYPRGEEVAARVAGAVGTIYTLSTLSGCLLEDVKKATPGPAWYQVYLCGGRDIAAKTIGRARDVGYSALVVTIDTAVAGMRERDFRNGTKELLTRRLFPMLPYAGQFISRPGWLASFLADGGLMKFPNVMLPEGPMLYTDVGAALEQSTVTWRDLEWIRNLWGGPIVVKGVHIGDDAKRAIDAGASAVVVSNHGGRQLDGVPATIRMLPEIVAAVDGRAEVLLDGGIRRGGDIVKAIAMGARAVLIGRAYAYGLGAGGATGVARAVEILRADVTRTLKLLGCPSIAALDGSYVDVPAPWVRHAATTAPGSWAR
ncbi:MAG: alpha-hydroxy-acid oxidizing protein [Acidobacteria bacterium]|nr:alpha-hydroxy-acid oxidizing protein [Acidobacteriota bacterium]